MPFIETLTGTWGVPTFHDTLDNIIFEFERNYAPDVNTPNCIATRRALCNTGGYDRTATVTPSFIRGYTPLAMLSMMLAQTTKLVETEPARKGKLPCFYLARSKGKEENPDVRMLEHIFRYDPRNLIMDNTSEYFDPIFLRIIHASSADEFTFAKDFLEDKGAAYDQGISAMLMPNAQHNVRLYRVDDKTFMLINRLSVPLVYRMYAMLPIIFNIDLASLPFPVDPAIFEAVLTKNEEVFLEKALSWMNTVNTKNTTFADARIRAMKLQQFTKLQNQLTIYLEEANKSAVHSKEDEIKRQESELRQAYNTLYALRLACETVDASAVTAFIDYLTKVPDLLTVQHRGNAKFGFVIQTTLQHYEVSEAKSIATSARARGNVTKARIIEALFIREDYRAVIRHGFIFDFNITRMRQGYDGFSAWDLNGTPFNTRTDALWNPHMAYFGGGAGCWGENGPFVQKALLASNYMVAFNQALSAMRSIYLNDGTAANHLYEDIMNPNYKLCTGILRVSDNARITCAEFLTEIARLEMTQNETD